MSKFISENEGSWSKKSWINDFTDNVKLARSLTEAYAEDVLEAVAEDFFPTLEAAITDLQIRTGLNKKEASDIRRVAIAMVRKADPSAIPGVAPVQDGVGIMKETDSAPVACKTCGGQVETVTQGNTSTEKCTKCGATTMKSMGLSAPTTSGPTGGSMPSVASSKKTIKKAKEESKECPECGTEMTESNGNITCKPCTEKNTSSSLKKDVVVAKGMNPGFRKYLDEQKAKKEGKKPKDDSKSEDEEMEKKDMKKEKEASSVSRVRASKSRTRLVKSWFQGADEPTLEGQVTSNDPSKLGYPKEMEYDNKPMAVPVGEDSRPWEQKWFEGAAAETKKVMGPQGSELAEKKELQRAKRMDALKAISKKK
jgi:ribosomal protein L37AE/L43A